MDHLQLNGFDPIVFDGKDPSAFAWAIFEMENRLEAGAEAIRSGGDIYPVASALWHSRSAQRGGVLWGGDEPCPQPALDVQPKH